MTMTATVDTEPQTEAQFLGNKPALEEPLCRCTTPTQHFQFVEEEKAPEEVEPYEVPQLVDMLLTAEQHATQGLLAFQSGELDTGIAYLQSALAFAQNYRHALRTPETAQ